MTPGKTLVLFDEVQGCPAVRMAIKFLVENGWFVYIKSGSLLGVRHKEERSCVASRPRCHEQAVFSYIVVGRMPEAVQTYADTHDIAKVVFKQNEILEPYRLDIAKCAEDSDKPKIRAIFDAILSQFNNKNRRFLLPKEMKYEMDLSGLNSGKDVLKNCADLLRSALPKEEG